MLAAEAADLVVAVAVAVAVAIIAAVMDGIVLMAVAAYGAVATAEHLGIRDEIIIDDLPRLGGVLVWQL